MSYEYLRSYMETIELRRLLIRAFHVRDVVIGDKYSISNHILTIDRKAMEEFAANPLIKNISLDVIKPSERDKYVNTIMDVIPISVKALGGIGEGITFTLTGVYVVLTGVDEDGRQMHEFGSSEGILREQMKFGMAGTPGENDIIIHMDVLLKGGEVFDRHLPNAAFISCDSFIDKIRRVLKAQDARSADETHEFFDKYRKGAKKVAIVKQVAGQGAMYDNLLLPNEPSGFDGGISVIDVGNMPVVLSPNEYRDGALRALV